MSFREVDDTEIRQSLDDRGVQYQDRGNYFVLCCLSHDERNPSMQLFYDGWCNCLAGCGRFHIATHFEELRGDYSNEDWEDTPTPEIKKKTPQAQPKPRQELIPQWNLMPEIPDDHRLKGVPASHMNKLGWRWDNGSYFMPYFTMDKDSIPFAQWRHLTGDRRFTFLKGAEPRLYGQWNLIDTKELYVVEGCSDFLVLDYCEVPVVAIPSAAGVKIADKLCDWAIENSVEIVYAGDNDEAGSKLEQAVANKMFYSSKQAPDRYKDYAEFFEAEGTKPLLDWLGREHIKKDTKVAEVTEVIEQEEDTTDPLWAVNKVFGSGGYTVIF